MAEIRLWIRGVHFAVNPQISEGNKSTPEMEERTVKKLMELDRERPEVVLVPEPTNPYDHKAIRAWYGTEPIGYVAHEQLDMAHRLFANPNVPMAIVNIDEVEIKQRGNFYVRGELPEGAWIQPEKEPVRRNAWTEWKCDIPQIPPQEAWTACRIAEFMIERAWDAPPESRKRLLTEPVKAWTEKSVHDFSMDAMLTRKRYIAKLLETDDEQLRKLARKLQKQMTAICSDRRMASRMKWWNDLQQSKEMEMYWDKWRSHRKEDHLWKDLQTVDSILRRMPGELYSNVGDLKVFFAALHYRDDVPRDVLWSIYSLLLLRERICRELGLSMKPLPEGAYGVEPDEPAPPVLTDARLARAVEEHQSYFWGKSTYGVVFCVCRDYFGTTANVSAFEKRIQALPYSKAVEGCPAGTIQKALGNNDYMRMHIDKWEEGRALKLARQLRTFLENSF